MITENHFGYLQDGREVKEFILDNGVIEAHILNYGGIIRSVIVSDKDGVKRDVVLGYDNPLGYEVNGGYLGAFIGRVANRTGKGKFTLNRKTYELFKNDGDNSLHGGENGFDKKIYYCEIVDDKLVLTGFSPDGEENYPGNLSIKIYYYLKNNSLFLDYECVCDKDTPISLTNHSYFNLSKEDTILNHYVKINADYITPIDKNLVPTGELLLVNGTPFDFKKYHKVGDGVDYPHRQIKLGGGYDHNFVLKNFGVFENVASCYSEDTGIKMDVYTNNLGLQFYTGNFLNGEVGKNGTIYQKRGAMCFETQNFPNAINRPSFPNRYIKKDEVYKRSTAYSFSILNS